MGKVLDVWMSLEWLRVFDMCVRYEKLILGCVMCRRLERLRMERRLRRLKRLWRGRGRGRGREGGDGGSA